MMVEGNLIIKIVSVYNVGAKSSLDLSIAIIDL
jgi:hypothetical protein